VLSACSFSGGLLVGPPIFFWKSRWLENFADIDCSLAGAGSEDLYRNTQFTSAA